MKRFNESQEKPWSSEYSKLHEDVDHPLDYLVSGKILSSGGLFLEGNHSKCYYQPKSQIANALIDWINANACINCQKLALEYLNCYPYFGVVASDEQGYMHVRDTGEITFHAVETSSPPPIKEARARKGKPPF